MQIIIEVIETGFLVVVQNREGRKVYAFDTGADVVAFVKQLADPSPIQVVQKDLTVVKP